MQFVDVSAILQGHGHHIDGIPDRVNDRRALDAELRVSGRASTGIARLRNGGDASRRIEKIHIPKRRCITALITIGIESVNAVMLRGDVHDVVSGIRRWNEHLRNIERLGGLHSIQTLREELSELHRIDVRRSQDHLTRVLTGAGIVVMLGQDGGLAERRGNAKQEKKNGNAGRNECVRATTRAAKSVHKLCTVKLILNWEFACPGEGSTQRCDLKYSTCCRGRHMIFAMTVLSARSKLWPRRNGYTCYYLAIASVKTAFIQTRGACG